MRLHLVSLSLDAHDGRLALMRVRPIGGALVARVITERRREQQREYNRRWRERNPGYARRKWLEWRYGLSPADYDEMLAAQGGGCAICAREPDGERPLCVDHDHRTSRVRGLLCSVCNRDVGRLERHLDAVLAYLGIRP